jgi:hypothetical protein
MVAESKQASSTSLVLPPGLFYFALVCFLVLLKPQSYQGFTFVTFLINPPTSPLHYLGNLLPM